MVKPSKTEHPTDQPPALLGVWRRPVPFSVALGTSIGLLVMLAVLLVLVIQWNSNRINTLELLNQRAEEIVSRIQSGVDGHLSPAVDQAAFIAERFAEGRLTLSDKEKLADFLTGALSGTPQISTLTVWGPELTYYGVTRDENGKPQPLSGRPNNVESARKAAKELADSQEAFWGEFVYNQKDTLINLRQPLHVDGKFIGFLIAAITVPELSELVDRVGGHFDATAFILFGRDKVLAHPLLVSAPGGRSQQDPLFGREDFDDEVLSSLWNGAPVEGFQKAAEQNIHVVEINGANDDFIAIYKPVEDYGNTPWLMGAWFPEQDIAAELTRLWWAGIVGIVVLLIAIAAAVLLGRIIAGPIRRASAGSARIGDLELAEVENLPGSHILELNEQARAFNRMLVGLRLFESYVPRRLVQRLIRRDGKGHLESRERELTIMFSDIVGFTTAAEKLAARDVANFLNKHFALVGACVEAQDGTVDKFIGDGLMAFWGAPDAQDNTALRACRAALAISRAIEEDNQARQAEGKRPVRVRIGLHTGPVVVGDIGWPGRLNYTIVGDAVNTCQRLEQAGKSHDRGDAVTILISARTRTAAGPSLQVEEAGAFALRGRSESLTVYRLLGESC